MKNVLALSYMFNILKTSIYQSNIKKKNCNILSNVHHLFFYEEILGKDDVLF